jgi:murein DD-endopeptidase MepM/ murein hydrolase activator NlpD
VFWFDDDESFFDQLGKEIGSFLLTTPVTKARISSTFNLNRFHPVLQRYRPHFGVDYAAPVGTPIKASGVGKVSFAGEKGGYGKSCVFGNSSLEHN